MAWPCCSCGLGWSIASSRTPAILPAEVISFVASQLGLPPQALSGYGRRPATRTAHVATICRHLGLRLMGQGDEEQLGEFVPEKEYQRVIERFPV